MRKTGGKASSDRRPPRQTDGGKKKTVRQAAWQMGGTGKEALAFLS
ncbi:MAG: hypothetical protein LBR73_04410 [Oscillospiraceae bacterium]|nr:hypothetical protein [Oscillospiraceae bacterium]